MKPFSRYNQAGITREEAKERILHDIPCTEYLTKAPHGGYICPYCGSGTGSHGTGAVKYYPKTNTCACHACPDTGQKARKFDVLDCIQHYYNCDYNAALEKGAERLGLTIRNYSGSDDIDNGWKAHKATQNAPETPQQAADNKNPGEGSKAAENAPQEATAADYTEYYRVCRERLANSPEAITYLTARGISAETAAAYNMGFDPAADPASVPGAMGNEWKPHPAKRIIVPCTPDFYIARSIDPGTPEAYKAPNPKGSNTKLFNAAALYNSEVVFVTEGIFDALSFVEIGEAAVATNGKGNGSLILEQLQARPTKAKIVICHDNDTDPKTAADTMKRANELKGGLQAMGVKSIVYNVAGAHHDANEALQADKEAFTAAAQAAKQEAGRDSLTDFLDAIQGETYKPYKTGLSFFDDLLGGGVIRQSLLLLLAAPATGKTTLAQQIAEAMAKNGKPVVYLNLEMSREQMLAKAISSRLSRKGIKTTALDVLQGYQWTDEQRQTIPAEIAKYRQEIFPYLQYNPEGVSSNLEQIREYLEKAGRQAVAEGKEAPAVILDYLHLVTGGNLDLQELIKQTVTMLKGYAIKYNTFVIGIVATNRNTNSSGVITMESGRDSSNLEYTADYQLGLNYYAIDKKQVDMKNPEEMAELLQQPWRQMIIRVLKGRLITPGKSARVYFHAAGNTFYGEKDWMPADDMRVPFNEDQAKEQEKTAPIRL